MKKNKKGKVQDEFSELLKKYKMTFFFGFVGMFFLLTIILGVLSVYSFSITYLNSSKQIIEEYLNGITRDTNGQFATINISPTNPRMVAIYYMEDADDSNQLSYSILGVSITEQKDMYNAYKEDATNLDKKDEYYIDKIEDLSVLTYVKTMDSSNRTILVNGQSVKYIKVYLNVEGEVGSRQQLIRTYITIALAVCLLSLAAGILMSRQGLQPLKLFVQKQIDFVSDASHELRTPLAVVQSKLENTLAEPDKTVYEVSESLSISLNEIGRLTKLVQELLTLARNDQNNIKLNIAPLNVDKTLKEIIDPFIEIALIQDRTLTYEGIDCYSKLDVDKLKQIMVIVIDNALKYTNQGDKIDISLSETRLDVIIEIKDTGIGISEETKKHIFERFYREDKARSRETGGNGLGLSIAYTLVSLQKGKIEVDHNTPKGTVFTITFPKYNPTETEKNALNENKKELLG